jgi:hypothetical protein
MSETRWELSRVALRVLSPIHAGYRKLGNVQMTRPYVTGNMVWGILTAGLTRALSTVNGGAAYRGMGRRVNDQLAFSYFYPSTREDIEIRWPWKEPDYFAWHYLGSYASTALDYGHFGAREGSLHETEFIRPNTPDGKPVFLIGYVFEDSLAERLPWREAMYHCQAGGERSYGWGRLEARDKSFNKDSSLFGLPVNREGERPEVSITEKKEYLLSHALANGLDADGAIEPLVSREWHNTKNGSGRGPGQSLKNHGICYAPGSVVNRGNKFILEPYGIWRLSK